MYDKRLNLLCRKSKNLPFESALGYNICITAKLYDQNYNMISKHFLIKYATVSEINATKQEIEALGPTDKRIDDIFLMSIEYYDENDVTLSLSEELRGIIYDIVYDSETNTIFLYGSNMDKLISVPLEVLQINQILINDIAILETEPGSPGQYQILQIQPKYDSRPPALYLSLERLVHPYKDKRTENGN